MTGVPLSVVLTPAGLDLPYDDLEVQQARRAVLAGRPFDLVVTFVREARFFDGSFPPRAPSSSVTDARGRSTAS